MNRPDIAAFVLGANSAWILTAALLLTTSIRRGWTSEDAKMFRNGLLAIGFTFAAGAVIVKVAL